MASFFEKHEDVAVMCLALVPFASRWAVVRTCRRFRALVGSPKFASVRVREEVLIVTTWGTEGMGLRPEMLLNGRWRRGPEASVSVAKGVSWGDSIAVFSQVEHRQPASAVFNVNTLTWHDAPHLPRNGRTIIALDDDGIVALTDGTVSRLSQSQWRQDHNTKLGDVQSSHNILYLSPPMNRKLYCVSRRKEPPRVSALFVYDLDADEWTDHGQIPFWDAIFELEQYYKDQWCTVALGNIVYFFINGFDEDESRFGCRIYLWDTDTLCWKRSYMDLRDCFMDCHLKPTIDHNQILALTSNQYLSRRLWLCDLDIATDFDDKENATSFHEWSDALPFPLNLSRDGSPIAKWVGDVCTVAL